MRIKSGDVGFYHYVRYGHSGDKWQFGATLESDAGEIPMVDFISVHLVKSFKKLTLTIGDFTARYGQGLAVWKSFSINALGSPSSLMKSGNGISPYKGADENNFFRGLAVSGMIGTNIDYSAFCSVNGVDATIKDGAYTSLYTDGLHHTDAEKAKKNSMMEYVAGGEITYSALRFKVGISAVAYAYSRPNGRRIYEYNRYQMYDGWHGNIAINALYSIGHLRIFGESGINFSGNIAAIAGAIWSPSFSFESSILLRHYPRGYIATHGNAYSSANTISNQEGVVISLNIKSPENFSHSLMVDGVYFPYPRYHVDMASWQLKVKAKSLYENDLWKGYLQENYCYKSNERNHKHSLKAYFSISPSKITATIRGDLCLIFTAAENHAFTMEKGYAVTFEGGYKIQRPDLNANIGVSYFNTDNYATRIYISEKDLPQSFGSSMHYGKGISYYITGQWRLWHGILRIGLKGGASHNL
ncbi:MAG: hypothetical protein HUJ90_05500, partial [Bacteroidales bacterium]|nr:hypothetical protein [Bacteroidales bacterium]